MVSKVTERREMDEETERIYYLDIEVKMPSSVPGDFMTISNFRKYRRLQKCT